MKRAVVTGAGGFVGRAIVRELLSQGTEVLAAVHSAQRIPVELRGSECVVWDMNEPGTLAEPLEHFRPDVFYHLAWHGSAGPLRGDEAVQLANVRGTCQAVRLAQVAHCSKFVFAASIMEYEVEAQRRKMLLPGRSSLYSAAKLVADHMARILASDLGLGYISGVISNIYGPGETSPRLINSSIRTLLRGERLSLSPGQQRYDFIYITDAARMFAAIGQRGVPGSVYYIGNRSVRPLRAFLEELRDVVAPGAELGFGDLPFHGVSLSYEEFDRELLYRDTGIAPEVSFAEGIRRTRDWIIEEDGHESIFL